MFSSKKCFIKTFRHCLKSQNIKFIEQNGTWVSADNKARLIQQILHYTQAYCGPALVTQLVKDGVKSASCVLLQP